MAIDKKSTTVAVTLYFDAETLKGYNTRKLNNELDILVADFPGFIGREKVRLSAHAVEALKERLTIADKASKPAAGKTAKKARVK